LKSILPTVKPKQWRLATIQQQPVNMTSRLRNGRTASSGLMAEHSPPRIIVRNTRTVFCITIVLLIIVATLLTGPMQLPNLASVAASQVPAAAAAAAGAAPATVAVTATISSCAAPPHLHGQGSMKADSNAGAKYILHEAAAAAASDPPALTMATATLEVECAFSIHKPTPSAAAATAAAAASAAAQQAAASKLRMQPQPQQQQQQQQQGLQQQGLQQQLHVLGVDVLTCAMHAKYPEAHQQQRYVFLLHQSGQKSAGELLLLPSWRGMQCGASRVSSCACQ
jgi:hypothetical protein